MIANKTAEKTAEPKDGEKHAGLFCNLTGKTRHFSDITATSQKQLFVNFRRSIKHKFPQAEQADKVQDGFSLLVDRQEAQHCWRTVEEAIYRNAGPLKEGMHSFIFLIGCSADAHLEINFFLHMMGLLNHPPKLTLIKKKKKF